MFRQVDDGMRAHAAACVEGWGYPREIDPKEIELGWWMKLERPHVRIEAFAWLLSGPRPSSVWLHVARNSDGSVTLGSERIMLKLETVAELMDADRIYVKVETHPRRCVMERYLRIHGWCRDEHGFYRELGGDYDG